MDIKGTMGESIRNEKLFIKYMEECAMAWREAKVNRKPREGYYKVLPRGKVGIRLIRTHSEILIDEDSNKVKDCVS